LKISENAGEEFYRNIRSACESGWDFSSRWFADGEHIQTIETLNLAEVDLNCLLWHLEKHWQNLHRFRI
jgi:alpha,alpha-trehalase